MNVVEHPVETKKRLAYIPEQVTLYRNLTGLENLRFFSRLRRRRRTPMRSCSRSSRRSGLTAEQARRRVAHLFEGHAAEGRHRDHDREGRVGAAARRADLGPRSEGGERFFDAAGDLSARGVAILMATHDLFRAKESGTRVGIMKHGRLVETLDTKQLGHSDFEQIYLRHMHD